ncbi:hypothetical protein GCM10010429_27630 [Micromonospora olivasterospora]|uniref:Uncharacterized protein n=1 Tax=Micromonospora olivasterospora TaxID=1880 RepID=A0A562I403_MICOL|nr:hypothetical protein JD77_00707 [Micromonospora olivasterospora]
MISDGRAAWKNGQRGTPVPRGAPLSGGASARIDADADRGRAGVGSADLARPLSAQLNESPQAQELPAFGLSIVKPWASIRSAKSMVAPAR